ncbi:class I SAM-dependent methyltransferase [Caballeronia sp. GAFFF2]|uniref:class I SAM-dependent methyltransferase n=1 Tax=Caballeronia sp. GAFFF2 TaxID=2921741 RepID=UPI002027AEC2|nr:class I SAM-dependent methyltransferase [Caballeronia sp. GAFFF2]
MMQKLDLSRFFTFDSDTGVWARRGYAQFDYTDGAAQEQYILEALKATRDLSALSTELVSRMVDWPSTYHLSPRRGNLLRPFASWFAGKRVLEIGCGCGAVTRFLGEAGADVISVEGSMMRATIARERCRDLDNVEVICATSDQVDELDKFDAVLLIGVLEYARKFLGPRGTERLLEGCRAQLAGDGLLFVAIENQLGLKYFAGAGEDHVGIPMFGIEERYEKEGVTTFGKRELSTFIEKAGFPLQQWWYPFPDYKLPLCVLGEAAVTGGLAADFGPIISRASAADPQRPADHVFALERAWQPVYRNGMAGELSNSFLVLASKVEPQAVASDAVAFQYAVDRLAAYTRASEFYQSSDGTLGVRYSAIHPTAITDESVQKVEIAELPFYMGRHWQHRLNQIVATPGWTADQLVEWYGTWAHAVLLLAGVESNPGFDVLTTQIDARFLGALPRNLIVADDGSTHFFGLEWKFGDSCDLGFLLFRGLFCAFAEIRSVAVPVAGTSTRFAALFKRVLEPLHANTASLDLDRYVRKEREFELRTRGHSEIDLEGAATAELAVVPSTSENYGLLKNQVAHLGAVCAAREAQLEQLRSDIARRQAQTRATASTAEDGRGREDLQRVQNELNALRMQHEALLNTKWHLIRAALLERPHSAKQLARVASLIASLLIPGTRR